MHGKRFGRKGPGESGYDLGEVRGASREGRNPRIISGNKPPAGAHIDLGWKAPPRLVKGGGGLGKKFKIDY